MSFKKHFSVERSAKHALGLGTHLTLFFLFIGLFAFIGWVLGITISALTLPVAFVLYVTGAITIAKLFLPDDFRSHLIDLSIFIMVSLCIFLAGITLFSKTHDTSYDGQAYHQTAIISFIHGWNPLYEATLPQGTLQGSPYVKGYPKLLWEQYATFAMTANNLNAATVLNIVPLITGFSFVYYLLSAILHLRKWSVPLAALAVVNIYFVQQVFTFMADGTSYEFGLGAIALLVAMFALKKTPLNLMIPFIGLLVILVGTKFNNAPLVLMLTALFLIHAYKSRAFLSRTFWRTLGLSSILALLILWSPFMINYFREKSFIYPQNLSEPQTTLRRDNIPPNISHSGPFVQLFYGVFSSVQPARAGSFDSPENVATLKLPFTFTNEEVRAAGDFVGRTSSAGALFSSAIVSSFILFMVMLWKSSTLQDKKIVRYTVIIAGLILLLGLINPTPNKLRYAPFITLLPLIPIAGSLLVSTSRNYLLGLVRVVIAAVVVVNITMSTIAIASLRQADFNTIETQRHALRASEQPIKLISVSFSSIAYQLDVHQIKYELVKKCSSDEYKKPIALSFQTAYFCAKNKPK